MSKRSNLLGPALLVLAAAALCAHEMNETQGQPPVTLQGEVVDLACYMGHEARGPKHQDCASLCIKGGAPIGLLTGNGTVYLLVEDHMNKDAYQNLKELAAQQVNVEGSAPKRGGLQAVIVEKVSKK